MKSVYKIFIFLLLLGPAAYATHLQGGEIMASQVSGQTYNIKVRLYLNIKNGEQASEAQNAVTVCFGDGNTKDFSRTSITLIPGNNKVVVAEYDGQYTYRAAGMFQISASVDNRTGNLLNLYNAQNTSMFLWTVIDTQVGNSTPVFPYLVFEAGVRQVFSLDLKPSVKDADSVTIRLPKLSKASPGTCGVRMEDKTYMYPNEVSASGAFKVIPAENKLVWHAPENVGTYIFAVIADEWRNGVIISQSYREGIIEVSDKPGPVVDIPPYEAAGTNGGPITSVPNPDTQEISMAIEAYPIPADKFITARVYNKTRFVVKLQLVDLNGRTLRQIDSKVPVVQFEGEFDLSNLARGLYLIRADNNTESVTKKIVH
ncbi:T9SS type A sorting domain-containing protein [Dyadobacter flavalbus]|uniref:T9SS type A sorting domain-containing protein n=1 Tax=Dyadobacter flavalbus TaxID=2579942 RepID=A0A5M8Q8K1_9BACT|nr:T9SS type A sorting domain-containing protein [Dyadobacter flavalbus]KAA6431468.1 T9SS type A sorting domain-containing protein [Dyadobacter flavalbus]